MNYPVFTPDIAIDATRFQMGFRDGKCSMMRGSFCDDVSYLAGFNAGLKLYRCSLPATIEAPLERGWGDERLNEI